MKSIIAAIVIAGASALTFTAKAQTQYYNYNDYNAGNGVHYYSDNYGNTSSSYTTSNGTTYYSGSNGQHCSSVRYGNQTSVSCY